MLTVAILQQSKGIADVDQAQLRYAINVFGFACKLCVVFIKDKASLLEHLKTDDHMAKFTAAEEERVAKEKAEAEAKAAEEAAKQEAESDAKEEAADDAAGDQASADGGEETTVNGDEPATGDDAAAKIEDAQGTFGFAFFGLLQLVLSAFRQLCLISQTSDANLRLLGDGCFTI